MQYDLMQIGYPCVYPLLTGSMASGSFRDSPCGMHMLYQEKLAEGVNPGAQRYFITHPWFILPKYDSCESRSQQSCVSSFCGSGGAHTSVGSQSPFQALVPNS